ncbi:unnamed protein product [Cuscuta campestris]|uniref:RNase H type-1 domain-containing protein n=1 Tax=Cuscuta campestris TaxID=132261 RepID=A0A484LUP9_9ASTE|nr:unnamed protein product [Cuscuta campestris]
MVATQPAVSAPVLPLGLSSIPTPSVVSPFTIPVPSAGPRVKFPPSMTRFMNDPANLQVIQGFGQVMAMCHQNGGCHSSQASFHLPSQALEQCLCKLRWRRLPSRRRYHSHRLSSRSCGDEEWDVPRAHKRKKGKALRAETSRNSAFQRLGDREEGQRKSAKLRLGQSVAHEEEAESQPRGPVANRLTIPNDRVQQMEAKLERLEKKAGEKNDRDKPLAGSPFTTRVHLTRFPRKVKIDTPRFTGKEDPEIHLDFFNQSATMNGSIDSFSDLASKFKAKFQENCTKRNKFTYLSTTGQRESENLTQFLTQWKEEVDKEAYHTAWEFAEAETQLRAKKEAEHGFKPKPVQIKKEEAPGSIRPRHHYDTVVRVVNTEECQAVRKALVNPLENPTGQTGRQWSGTYCSFHRSDSHNTSECKSVKGVIRKMIDSGELGEDYMQKAQEKSHQWIRPAAQGNDRDNDQRRNNRKREQQPALDKEHIGMIFGGPEGGDSVAQRKNWVCSIYVGEVSADPVRRKQRRREPIVSTDRDLPATGEDHNDPLVITMDINVVDVARVLVDTGSSVNILYLEIFQKLRLCRTQLEPLKTPLSGFTGDTMEAEGPIVLPVELESGDKTVWKKMRFIIVDIKYNLRLNPKKCVFTVRTRKFLGFMATKRGIEPNPEKIRAITEMQAPTSVRDVQKLTGCLAALSWFLSRSAERSLPFFNVLKKANTFAWDEDCQKAFEELKEYLVSDIVLSKPEQGETLYLYLGISPNAVSSILIRDDGAQKPIYYVSKALNGAESRYTTIEKTAYALFISAKKLTSYFQAHPVEVLTDQPLGAVLQNSTSSGRMVKGAMMLTQFNIGYRPRSAIKGQALADFLVEMTGLTPDLPVNKPTEQWWEMAVDGAYGPKGYRGGILFTTREGFKIYHALVFNFKLTNNEAEYEALAGGLRLAQALKISSVSIKSDSSLIVGQVTGNMEAIQGPSSCLVEGLRRIQDRPNSPGGKRGCRTSLQIDAVCP